MVAVIAAAAHPQRSAKARRCGASPAPAPFSLRLTNSSLTVATSDAACGSCSYRATKLSKSSVGLNGVGTSQRGHMHSFWLLLWLGTSTRLGSGGTTLPPHL